MEDIIKDNKEYRICYVCRKELILNSDNFYRNKTKNKGYEYCCKNCAKHRLSKYYKDMSSSNKEVKNIKTKEFRNSQYDKGLCRVCKESRLYDLKTCKKHYLMDTANRHLGTTTRWEELEKLLIKQEYKCPYTGNELVLGKNASIDHIKPLSKFPELNYDIDNLQWVDNRINFIKSNNTEEDFLSLIKQIYEYKKP